MPTKPKTISIGTNFLRLIIGSSNAVNKPADDKQVKAIETFEYLILP